MSIFPASGRPSLPRREQLHQWLEMDDAETDGSQAEHWTA